MENKTERLVRGFANSVFSIMKWGKMPVSRFKVGNMSQYRGYAMLTDVNTSFVIISTNPSVYPDNATEQDFWYCVLHELIHIYMAYNGYSIQEAFGHGKKFKQLAKLIEIKTDGEWKSRRILK